MRFGTPRLPSSWKPRPVALITQRTPVSSASAVQRNGPRETDFPSLSVGPAAPLLRQPLQLMFTRPDGYNVTLRSAFSQKTSVGVDVRVTSRSSSQSTGFGLDVEKTR